MKLPRLCLLILLAALFITPGARAQKVNTNVAVNFIYAFELGFGSYDIGGLNVQVYSIPLEYTFSKIMGNEKLDLVVTAPLYFGRFRFRSHTPDGTRIKVDQDVMSVIPGVSLHYRVVDNWTLKPFVNAGLAWQVYDKSSPSGLKVDDSLMYVWAVGMTSLYEMFWEQFRFSLGNTLAWSGVDVFGGGEGQNYGIFQNGIEARRPLGFSIKGYEPDASIFFIWYRFLPKTTFDRYLHPPLVVKNQYEISMTAGLAKPDKIWFLQDPRIGVGYRFGDLNAFTVNFGFPF
jgi:hypothetical protein